MRMRVLATPEARPPGRAFACRPALGLPRKGCSARRGCESWRGSCAGIHSSSYSSSLRWCATWVGAGIH
eukprot:5293037-Alexandrium_andersonii.AAC.1